MAAARRCPVCRGSLHDAAPNRKYCSQPCRQQAYRQRATPPAQRRRAAAVRRAAIDAAAVDVERLLGVLDRQLAYVRLCVQRRISSARLTFQATELAANVELLSTAAVGYDRAAGITWTELAFDSGVDETTLRRRQRRAAAADLT